MRPPRPGSCRAPRAHGAAAHQAREIPAPPFRGFRSPSRSLVLPLHQRLMLRRAGELAPQLRGKAGLRLAIPDLSFDAQRQPERLGVRLGKAMNLGDIFLGAEIIAAPEG